MLLLLDANGALFAVAVGLLLICAEFCLPGWVLPGVAGGVCLLCGAFRLGTLDASAAAASGAVLAVAIAAAAGYGLLPAWLALGAIPAVPILCRSLIPGAVHWPAALASMLPPVAAFFLLRVAARAVANKTLVL